MNRRSMPRESCYNQQRAWRRRLFVPHKLFDTLSHYPRCQYADTVQPSDLRCLPEKKDVSTTRGKYIDLKNEPGRAVELPEAREWPAFGDFIEAINRCPAFRTAGCATDGGSSPCS